MSVRLVSAGAIRGKRVLLRADFDVSRAGRRVLDDFRIRQHVPTIRFLLRHGGKIRVVAHLGRPGGRRVPSLSLRPLARVLSRAIGTPVRFVADPIHHVRQDHRDISGVLLFENIRFWPGEEKNDRHFAGRLARWADVYVNEAFANSHRNHASMAAVTNFLPAYAGFHLRTELAMLKRVRHPRPPVVAILGGAKLETKLPLMEAFLARGGAVLVGGTLANTLFLARGLAIGKSVADHGFVRRLRRSTIYHSRLHLPVDLLVGRTAHGASRVVQAGAVGPSDTIFDIGPRTVAQFGAIISKARTVIWNGPLGFVEVFRFSRGTLSVARRIRRSRGFRVVGGGDTVALLHHHRLLDGFSHVSTGGGAMLAYLAGEKLPGLEALKHGKHEA